MTDPEIVTMDGQEYTITRLDGTTLTVMERREPPLLTGRETQILDLLAQGSEYKEISEVLGLSIDTIKSHLKRVYRKLGARNGSHAIALAIAAELIKPRTGGAQ